MGIKDKNEKKQQEEESEDENEDEEELSEQSKKQEDKPDNRPLPAEQYIELGEVDQTAVTVPDGDLKENNEVDAKLQPPDEEPSKIKGYICKGLMLALIIYLGILYIKDHSWEVEKGPDGECPLYSHRVYGEDCTLNKFKNLEEEEEPDVECQSTFQKNEDPFVCKWEICLNRKNESYWDPDGFCVDECSENTFLEGKLCAPNCPTEQKWNSDSSKCMHYMNQIYPGLKSINECGGEKMAKIKLWEQDYFKILDKNKTCAKKSDINSKLMRILTINYPPPGYRFVYVDEMQNNNLFKEEVFYHLKKYDV